MRYRISVDSGGTFTDGVLINESGDAVIRKAHTTPDDPTVGTLECIAKLAAAEGVTLAQLLDASDSIVLGTTMATNVVATHSGPKMGTIATRGYRLRMAFPQVAKADWKEGPADMYDFRTEPPEPLTPYYLMTEVEERVDFRGQVLTPLNEDDVRRAVRQLKSAGVTTIAVTLLHSQVNPAHERRIAEIIAEESPGTYVALSSTVLPVSGETERWSTTMFCAYVAPVVTAFVSRIVGLLADNGFKGQLMFIQSNGGIATPEIVKENPAVLLLSGPAAGPSLARMLGLANEFRNVLSVDMGGTSFDIGVIHDGTVDTVKQQIIDGKKFSLPCVDVTAIGAGGGSIAHVDAAGRLQVGPEERRRGAGPGLLRQGRRAAHGHRRERRARLHRPGFLPRWRDQAAQGPGGKGDPRARRRAARARRCTQAAAAIYEIINSNMASGTDVAFAKRGYDPRDFALCAAGGAAAVHAVRIMQELRIKKLIVPKVAPTYCAYGMLFSDLKHDYQRTYHAETGQGGPAAGRCAVRGDGARSRATRCAARG